MTTPYYSTNSIEEEIKREAFQYVKTTAHYTCVGLGLGIGYFATAEVRDA